MIDKRLVITLACLSGIILTGCATSSGTSEISPSNPLIINMSPAGSHGDTTPLPSDNAATSTSENAQQQLITKDASELALALDDFPVGWKLVGEEVTSEGTQEGYFSRTFVSQELGMTQPLVCRVKVFSSINHAEEEYSSILAEVTKRYSFEKTNIGDDSFAYEETGFGFRCVFIKRNVIGIIDMSTFLYGGSLDDVKKYADLLGKRIS